LAGNVSVFAIDAATGALTATSSAPAGTDPVALNLDASGKFAYAVNLTSNNVTQFTVDPTSGALTPAGSPVNTGTGPVWMALTN
jgi:6-phosphogluconolactonase (cycloisomerase 2 family)